MSGYDPRHPDVRWEPAPHHARLREWCPVSWVDAHDPPFVAVVDHERIFAMLRDPERWRNGDGPGVEHQPGGVLGSADGDDHLRHRLVLQRAMTPRRIAGLRPRVEALADELLDGLVERGSADLVAEYAHPLPTIVIAELLGVPPADRAAFRAWSDAIVTGLGGEDLAEMTAARDELHHYLGGQLRTRAEATDPPDDLMTLMVRSGRLNGQEMRQLALQLLVAGNETTTSLLGLLLHRLMERPELMEELRRDRSLVEKAVEEALRFDSPVQGLFRTSPDDQDLAGCPVPAGTKVQLLFASANRDPAVFDRPDEFRLDRDRIEMRRHLAFGTGPHFCIGAPLARLEAEVTLDRVLDRMPGLRPTGPPTPIRSFILRGFASLPVAWDAPAA